MGRLADTGKHPPIGHLAVENVLDEGGQAIEDLVQERWILFHADPRRVHVDADDRLEQAHERPRHGLQADLAEQELGQLPAVLKASLLDQPVRQANQQERALEG